MLSAKGQDGLVELSDDGIRFERVGFFGKLQKGNNELGFIPYSKVVGVGFKAYSLMTNQGHIQFGVLEEDGSYFFSDKGMDTISHPKYAITFGKKASKDFEEIKKIVTEKMTGRAGTPHEGTPVSKDVQLVRLKELQDMGVLTQAEYDKEVAKLK